MYRLTGKHTACATAISLCLGAFTAQTATAQTAADSDEIFDEIIVTALKRSTSLQETPAAISAISSETLRSMGATGLDDVFRFVPGLVVQEGETGGGRGRLSVRGIRSQGEATLGLYYDETPIIGSNGTSSDPGGRTGDLNLFDIERVEVLRGPQGTLYGASSMGGAIRILFNKPNFEEYEGEVLGQMTDTKGGGFGYAVKGMVNVPFNEKFAARLVLSTQDTDGYVDNVTLGRDNVNDSEQQGGRLILGFKPSDTVNFTLTGVFQKSTLDGSAYFDETLGFYNSNDPVLLSYEENFKMISGVLDWDLGFATLTSSTGWQKSKTNRTVDATATVNTSISFPTTPCRIYFGLTSPDSCTADQIDEYTAYAETRTPGFFYAVLDNEVFTQEIRLSSNDSGPFQWTVGGYYEKRDDHIDSYVVTADAETGELITPIDVTGLRYIQNDVKQTALFAEASYEVIEDLTLTAGIRRYNYKKTISGEVLIPSAPTFQAPGDYSSVDADASGWVTKYGADYKINDDIMVYATIAEGFRPGGVNNTPNLPTNLEIYDADSLWNYEIGLKTSWFDNKLIFNTSLFRTDWKNMQITGSTPDNVFRYLTNAGSARVEGIEFDAMLRPTSGLTFTATFAYLDAYLTEDQSNENVLVVSSTGLKGDKIPYVPEYTASLSAEYITPVTDTLNAIARLDYSYTGESANGFRPTYLYYATFGDYSMINARLGLEAADWKVSLFARNLMNSKGITNNGGAGTLIALTPRTIGINLGYSF
ncbi:TonB-dependent receptor [Kordiimonas pumila]|uniref:TonB-dependent receptor n=1 Tax=Kordiimonas pumila TaxID=2161677 RepID=A0ABV7D060_9PROT|nr:TonB-dependent receptor [Kordiimonas pumila]